MSSTTSSSPTKTLAPEPPANSPVLDGNNAFTQPWANYFGSLADIVRQTTPGAPGAPGAPGQPPADAVILQTGTGSSDNFGAISVALPTPYATRTLGFQCDARPTEPLAFFNQGTVQSLPLDVITGVLSKEDISGGSVVAVPNAPFTWFAMGV